MIIGRFAPSPTGPLHMGSLVAAMASYLVSRQANGRWLVRIDDLDNERCSATHSANILRTLEDFGLLWDGSVLYQSQRQAAYQQALEQLAAQGDCFACHCTRKQLRQTAAKGIDGLIYPGTCRGHHALESQCVIRCKTSQLNIHLNDELQAPLQLNIQQAIGDFVIRRADGQFSYQLAVVVDDAAQGITHVVRGADLFHTSLKQIYLQQLLNIPTPHYCHLPIMCTAQGEKLSKQTHAPPLQPNNAIQQLLSAWQFLGQKPAPETPSSLDNFWLWAKKHWNINRIPTSSS